MHLLLLFGYFALITCHLNFTDTTNKIKFILNKYKNSSKCSRFQRCLKKDKINNFVGKTLTFFDKTERFGDFLRYRNVSDCDNENSESYTREHILKGLLVHGDVPDWHWHEYKVKELTLSILIL